MNRPHLFEFIDLEWWPRVLRNLETDALQSSLERTYDRVAPKLAEVIEQTGNDDIIDLCSGASGPWPHLIEILKEKDIDVDVKLTDKFPNQSAIARLRERPVSGLHYLEDSVPADKVPEKLTGLRTMFSGFHHLRPEEAHLVLKDAAEKRQAICIFDGVSARDSIGSFLLLLIIPPIVLTFMFLLSFTIKPTTGTRILFHTLIPIVPIVMAWDAAVSLTRAYKRSEMEELTSKIQVPGYSWEIGKVQEISYLVGHPG